MIILFGNNYKWTIFTHGKHQSKAMSPKKPFNLIYQFVFLNVKDRDHFIRIA